MGSVSHQLTVLYISAYFFALSLALALALALTAASFHVAQMGPARQMEEYVPTKIPMIMGSANALMEVTPKR